MLTEEKIYKIVLLIIVGYPLLFAAAYLAEKALAKRYNRHTARLIRRSIVFIGIGILSIDILREVDLKLTALLGSAGIAGMALSFALKTSVSNIISGLFISIELPFAVGDFIEIDNYKGTILSFDLLSIKICSPENNFIRIPNEQLLKNNVINHSKYPTKRLSIPIQFPYDQCHDPVYQLVEEVLKTNKFCLKEPPARVKFSAFADSAISCDINVWVNSNEYSQAKKSIASDLHQAFIKAGIEMPFPHQSLTNQGKDGVLRVEVHSGSRNEGVQQKEEA